MEFNGKPILFQNSMKWIHAPWFWLVHRRKKTTREKSINQVPSSVTKLCHVTWQNSCLFSEWNSVYNSTTIKRPNKQNKNPITQTVHKYKQTLSCDQALDVLPITLRFKITGSTSKACADWLVNFLTSPARECDVTRRGRLLFRCLFHWKENQCWIKFHLD